VVFLAKPTVQEGGHPLIWRPPTRSNFQDHSSSRGPLIATCYVKKVACWVKNLTSLEGQTIPRVINFLVRMIKMGFSYEEVKLGKDEIYGLR
jgi:hypothetical protein